MSKFADVAPTTAPVAASPLATGTPAAQFEITPDLVEGLLRRQHPDRSHLDLNRRLPATYSLLRSIGIHIEISVSGSGVPFRITKFSPSILTWGERHSEQEAAFSKSS